MASTLHSRFESCGDTSEPLWMPVRLSAVHDETCTESHEDILSTYYKCTVAATSHRMNVSGHMLIWTLLLMPKFVLIFPLQPAYRNTRDGHQTTYSYVDGRSTS
jgi:hypothetical protein